MPIKKSELYSSIWASCDELRGGMDASQYKDYVLVLLFVKYVSDKYAGQKNPLIIIPKGGSFKDMIAAKGDKDIGNKMNIIIAALAKENGLKGVIDLTDFNDPDKLGKGKEMVDRLSKLVAIFENPALDFTKNRAEGDDLLGDAYEYLMRHFATESGKSKGQFYTPAEVSRIMAKVIGVSEAVSANTTIYDPTCGSGSLLLKAADEAKVKISIYGQEMDNSTAGLARMNMILHDNPSAEIWKDNTLSEPHYKEKNGQLKQFDYAVANPPFSTSAWKSGFDPEHDLFGRFEDGMPPEKNGDYAFLQHLLRSLKSTGKGAIILPHGVLFRGGAEGVIRRNLISKGYIKGIIGLPANLFYGTGIPACIIVLDKENAAGRKGIFMINASQGFVKDGNKNRLRHQDLHKIVDVFTRQLDVPKYARMVALAEISNPKNDYNLNIPRYIDNSEEEDLQDIAAHLLGGIPNHDLDKLKAYWKVLPSLQVQLFEAGARAGYSQMKVDASQVKPTIFNHPEFSAFNQGITAIFSTWMKRNKPLLSALEAGSHPKALIETLSEDLLTAFAPAPLIDKYDVYQALMTYWSETMQDDVYMIAIDGWVANPELIPAELIERRYFSAELKEIEKLRADYEVLIAQIEEMNEEYSGEESLLSAVYNEKGKVNKGSLKARIKELTGKNGKPSADNKEQFDLLNRLLDLFEAGIKLNREVREAQEKLGDKVSSQYAKLSVNEIKTLVIEDKWFATFAAEMDIQVQTIATQFAGRIKELAERYSSTLSELNQKLEMLSSKVENHFKKLGVDFDFRDLLTGKKRLPEFDKKTGYKQTPSGLFPEDWDVIPLKQISSMHGRIGWQGLKQTEFTMNSEQPFLITGMNFKDGDIRWDEVYHVPWDRYEMAKEIQLKTGDVLMTKDGTIGKILFVDEIPYPGKATLNSHLLVFRPLSNKYNPKFLFYQLNSKTFFNHVEQEKSGTTFFGITQEAVGKYNAFLPSLPEQTAIAEILSDMDAEISALEQKREKTRLLKQGMMQELLTGRIRLL